MSTTVVRLFVDRRAIYEGFDKMLSGASEKQIMLVQAPGGMGKSWLVARLKHECSRREPRVRYASLDFKDGLAHDYLDLVRRGRDDLGAAYFNNLTQVINATTGIQVNLQIAEASPGGVSVGDVSQVHEAEVNIAGGHVVKDNFFLVQVDSESVRREIEGRITEVFLEDLRRLLSGERVVLFFDTYERASEATRRWIEANLLVQVRDGKLPGLIVVITGRETPEVDLMWKHCTTRPRLEPLSSKDVGVYLREKRGLSDVDVDTLYRATQGNPQLLGILADNLDVDDDDDW